MTKATVYYNGLVVWQPPAVYKSSCAIDVEYFPYDVQTCVLKLGSWTYDGFKVTLLNSRTSVFTPTSTPHLGQTIPYLVVFVTVTRHSSCTFSYRYYYIRNLRTNNTSLPYDFHPVDFSFLICNFNVVSYWTRTKGSHILGAYCYFISTILFVEILVQQHRPKWNY